MSEKLKIALLKCVHMLAEDMHYEGYVNLSPEPKVNTGVDNSAQTNPIKVTAVIFQWLCVPFLFANEVCMLMSYNCFRSHIYFLYLCFSLRMLGNAQRKQL